MDKRIEFMTEDGLGHCFAEAIDITPRGGGLEKVAGTLHPELAAYIKDLRPDPRYQYVLMTPMGAWEYWGQNVNGDVFPEIALSYDRDSKNPLAVAEQLERKFLEPFGKKIPPGNYTNFGYKTFLEAERYRHHVNKNPELSYGQIPIVVWNENMHRVELISRHDREKAKRVGAEEIIIDIDAGKPRQISMGCKVPFDVCTICGHISRTPHDYCRHLRLQMGSTMDDGRIVAAVNFFPRFFDLSDVFIPAAKESGVLQKVAAQRTTVYIPHEDVPTGYAVDESTGQLVKMASAKIATTSKKADITKQILPNSGYKAVSKVSDCEPDIPKSSLLGGDFSQLLTTLAMLGVVLKPHEFQHSLLSRMGKSGLADRLHSARRVFSEVPSTSASRFSADDYSPQLARLLAPLLENRSAFHPHLPRRVIRITVVKAKPAEKHASAGNDEILQKVASAYSSYRNAFRGLAPVLNLVVESDSEYYRENFFGDLLTDHMAKTAASAYADGLSTVGAPLYLYNAHRTSASELPSTWNNQLPEQSPAKALLHPVL